MLSSLIISLFPLHCFKIKYNKNKAQKLKNVNESNFLVFVKL